MNAQRRKALAALRDRMSELQSQVTTLAEEIQDVCNAEQDYLDGMPENLRDGEKGTKAQTAIDLLENLISGLTEFTDLESDHLDDAAE